jgi:hypothetical protein
MSLLEQRDDRFEFSVDLLEHRADALEQLDDVVESGSAASPPTHRQMVAVGDDQGKMAVGG